MIIPSDPTELSASALMQTALDTVMRQLAANKPASEAWGYDEDGALNYYCKLDARNAEANLAVIGFEIRYERLSVKTANGWREVALCFISATDANSLSLASGIIGGNRYLPIGPIETLTNEELPNEPLP